METHEKIFVSIPILILILLLLFPFWKGSIGHYSEGERIGLLNKISRKGTFCKTYEGYILVGNGQNIQPEQFNFTVKNEELAKEIMSKVGKNITLQYDQKLIAGGCWGDTRYEITGFRE